MRTIRFLKILIPLLFVSINVWSSKNASLYIYPDKKTLSPLFINKITVKGDDTLISKEIYYNNTEFLVQNIPTGNYLVEYLTNFQDTIKEWIYIKKNKKYSIAFPEKTYYTEQIKNQESITFLNSIDNGVIYVYIFSTYGSQVTTEHRLKWAGTESLYTTKNYGMLKDFYKDKYLVCKNIDSIMLNEFKPFLDLSLLERRICNDEKGIAIVMKNKKYIQFEFCPSKEKDFETFIHDMEHYLVIFNER